jgi:hypothetical protein
MDYLPVVEDSTHPCGSCKPRSTQLPMESRIAVGFGLAELTRDGESVWVEQGQEWEDCMTVADAEELASRDPDHDWRIELYGPLRGSVHQRQGPGCWMLVSVNDGFA